MREILDKILAASSQPTTEKVNMDERVGLARELMELLHEPAVVEKLKSVDEYYRSSPSYPLGEYRRDDTRATVSLVLCYGDAFVEDDIENGIEMMFIVELMSIDIDNKLINVIEQTTGSKKRKSIFKFLKEGYDDYRWVQNDEFAKSFTGSRRLLRPDELAHAHGSHLEQIAGAILALIVPPDSVKT